VQHVVDADDVEEGFLLAGERGVGKVLGSGGGAHGHRDVGGAGILAELDVSLADGLLEVGGEGGVDDPAADFLAAAGQFVHVVHIEGGQALGDALREAALLEVGLEGVGRGGEAARHGDTQFRQVADHLAKGGVLAAHLAQVGHAQRVEPKYQVAQGIILTIGRRFCGGPRDKIPALSGAGCRRNKARRTNVQRSCGVDCHRGVLR
jgi:hypothetical protein